MVTKSNPLYIDIASLPLTISSLAEIKDPLKFPPPVTLQGFSKDITSKFTCMICKEVLSNPVKTLCKCSATICSNCFLRNYSKCPICRKVTSAVPNDKIQKQLEMQEIVCRCGVKYYHGEKDDHDASCKLSEFECPQCRLPLNGPDMILHLRTKHYAQVLVSMANIR